MKRIQYWIKHITRLKFSYTEFSVHQEQGNYGTIWFISRNSLWYIISGQELSIFVLLSFLRRSWEWLVVLANTSNLATAVLSTVHMNSYHSCPNCAVILSLLKQRDTEKLSNVLWVTEEVARGWWIQTQEAGVYWPAVNMTLVKFSLSFETPIFLDTQIYMCKLSFIFFLSEAYLWSKKHMYLWLAPSEILTDLSCVSSFTRY